MTEDKYKEMLKEVLEYMLIDDNYRKINTKFIHKTRVIKFNFSLRESEILQYSRDEKLKQLGALRTAITASQPDVAITARGEGQFDCVSRYFAPAIGINEDPVTGSIHTAIAPLWAEKLDQTQLIAYQASVRGGILECVIESEDRIEISGYAKLYMQAELTI